jgi:hypothetical protein
MGDLFTRTVSEALQALLPAAAALALYRRAGHRDAVRGVTWGVVAALLTSAPAGWLFQQSARQALWEASLALLALSAVVWVLRRRASARPLPPLMLAAVTMLLVTRQTMEIASVFGVAAFQLRSADALVTICAAAALGAALASAWLWVAARMSVSTCTLVEKTFCALFIAQLAMYAFHESAEARLLPWSEPLHAATEPYGPDGIYGQYFSWLLLVAPLAAAALARLRAQWHSPTIVRRAGRARHFASVGIALLALGDGVSLRSAGIASAPNDAIASIASADHVIFRHTGVDDSYSTLSLAPLAQPSSRRLSTGIPCERVSFGGQRGLCLQATRRLLTTYRAVLFDRDFNTVGTWALTGGPSRTRVAPDGRVGAITVFVIGHGYGSSTFSTRTTLVDMASGDQLGDLEEFTTWRDGARIKGQDFNFWGVTFGRDSNIFYATLGTQGKTYLVKGDLALRKLTVLRDGVECPSLSPDARHIAFKKRTGGAAARWRVAVLDLATMTDHVLASEARHVDDQIEWLDNHRVLYALPRADSAVTDVWVADIDANVAPQVLIPSAESPIVVHTVR